jgi:hypothetical protein
MRRGIWIAAAVIVAVMAAIPLSFVLVGGDAERRPGAVGGEVDCSDAKDIEACERLKRQQQVVESAYKAIGEQLVATASLVGAWHAQEQTNEDEAPEAAAEVSKAVATLDDKLVRAQREMTELQQLSTSDEYAHLEKVDLQTTLQLSDQTLQLPLNALRLCYEQKKKLKQTTPSETAPAEAALTEEEAAAEAALMEAMQKAADAYKQMLAATKIND